MLVMQQRQRIQSQNRKKEAKTKGKGQKGKLQRDKKDTEVTMEDMVSHVDVIPQKVGEVVINESIDMEEPGEAIPEEDDESNFFL